MQSTLCDFLQNSVIVHTFLADPQSLCVKAFFGITVHKKHRFYIFRGSYSTVLCPIITKEIILIRKRLCFICYYCMLVHGQHEEFLSYLRLPYPVLKLYIFVCVLDKKID